MMKPAALGEKTKKQRKKEKEQKKLQKEKQKFQEESIKEASSVCWVCSIMKGEMLRCDDCKLATYCSKEHLEQDREEHKKRCGWEKEGLSEIGINKLLIEWISMPPSVEIIKIMKAQAVYMNKSIVLQIKPILSGEGILIQYLLAGCTFSVDGPLKLRLDFIYNNIRITKIFEIKLNNMSVEEATRLAKMRKKFHDIGICSFSEELAMFPSDTEVNVDRDRRKIRSKLPLVEYSVGKITRESGLSHFESIRIEHIEYNPK